MKNNCRRTYRVRIKEFGIVNKQIAAGFVVHAWEEVNSEVLNEACSIYEDFDGPEDWSKMSKDHLMINVVIPGE
jgi:hypothetical protein